eukprot:TRINITY_DN1054_c0_g1_i2.p1 TRINITY_DN1054_c0_g1~~TRINITY_DN1054_c0_g1_i2.p1  ORF type:complete len:435 (+),score=110.21 TRINITY_DN1054_c0_g1_i2:145-1449(+)
MKKLVVVFTGLRRCVSLLPNVSVHRAWYSTFPKDQIEEFNKVYLGNQEHAKSVKIEQSWKVKPAEGVDLDELPNSFKNKNSKGRGLFATRDFKAGELIFCEEPFASFPSAKYSSHNKHCHHCLRPLQQSFFKCSKCTGERNTNHNHNDNNNTTNNNNNENNNNTSTLSPFHYCSEECRDIAWKQHHQLICPSEPEYGNLDVLESHCNRADRKFPLVAARIMQRLLLGVIYEGGIQTNWNKVLLLTKVDLKTPDIWKEDYEKFSPLLLHPSHERFFDLEWYTKVMQTLHLNALSISIDSLNTNTNNNSNNNHSNNNNAPTQHGTGLFLLTSFINHSCKPNSRYSFPSNHTIHVFAGPNGVKQGEELTISYIHTDTEYAQRQSHLYKHYGFRCACEKCIEEGKLLGELTEEQLQKGCGTNSQCDDKNSTENCCGST